MQGLSPLPVNAIDYLELYVGNARQAAYFYQRAFGFSPIAYAGPETGVRDRASYVLGQANIRLVVTSALSDDHPIASHALRHGDGVHDIALRVDDAESTYQEALRRGATGVLEPATFEDDGGMYRRAAIATYGDTVHSFIERNDYRGPFAPGYEAWTPRNPAAVAEEETVALWRIDHVVGNVQEGRMDEWVDFYASVFGFTQLISFEDRDISTEYSSLRSKVMRNEAGTVVLPINEPASGRKKSQIQEYLDYHGGPGVQHVALRTETIIPSVSAMRHHGVDFLQVPGNYYQALPERIGSIEEPLDELERLAILADRDDRGYLLQIFTQTVQDRPTLFFEVIQRNGSESFGKGNFKALFEAIEREQARRGNLVESTR